MLLTGLGQLEADCFDFIKYATPPIKNNKLLFSELWINKYRLSHSFLVYSVDYKCICQVKFNEIVARILTYLFCVIGKFIIYRSCFVSLQHVLRINPVKMKSVDIRFFSVEENSQPKENKEKAPKAKKVILKGYISNAGKVVFPAKIVANLAISIENSAFKVGMQDGKRKAKILYIVPAADDQVDVFQFEKAAKSYTLSLPFILKKNGIDFKETKYEFIVELADYQGSTVLELQLSPAETAPKAPYSGKPRGRKPKEKEGVE